MAVTKLATTQFGSGALIQTVYGGTGGVATGTTTIPLDDSIPQITEGDEYLTPIITPTAVGNYIDIEVTAVVSNSASSHGTMALFQGATANALAATTMALYAGTAIITLTLRHRITAASISPITFHVRIGFNAAGTTTFNGTGGGRIFGGAVVSNWKVTEYQA